MNQVPVIVRNPAYVADVELDEDEVDPADHTPLVSGNAPIVAAPASEDENVAEDVVEDRNDDEEMEDVPQMLRDVISSLEELNKHPVPCSWGHILPSAPCCPPYRCIGHRESLGA